MSYSSLSPLILSFNHHPCLFVFFLSEGETMMLRRLGFWWEDNLWWETMTQVLEGGGRRHQGLHADCSRGCLRSSGIVWTNKLDSKGAISHYAPISRVSHFAMLDSVRMSSASLACHMSIIFLTGDPFLLTRGNSWGICCLWWWTQAVPSDLALLFSSTLHPSRMNLPVRHIPVHCLVSGNI